MIIVPRFTALELETAQCVEGYYYLENGYFMSNGVPDINQPVKRYYMVDDDGVHREIAESTVEILDT
jgi:hypothetical protein